MLSFKTNNTINKYAIKVENSKQAIATIDEILNQQQEQKITENCIINTNYGDYKKLSS